MKTALDIAMQIAFWGFGVLGLFAITLLPWRSLRVVGHGRALSHASIAGRFYFVLLVLAAITALIGGTTCTYEMSRCLLGYHCSANRAGGWIYLAGVGVWYAVFEFVAFIVVSTARRVVRHAT